ncbi:MAG TPA: FecR domain-containing protein [Thermoanaerobaculia bacterium]|nr:FecR domain-containing protein [Thermoanaerobaculia bacterium]
MSLFKKNDDTLDRAIAEVTSEPVDPVLIEQAAARVWERLSQGAPVHRLESQPAPDTSAAQAEQHHSLRGCADFQSLIPAYLRGELPAARALLVEDHTRTCIPCRRALRDAREGLAVRPAEIRPAVTSAMFAGRRGRVMWQSLAAALVVGVGFGIFILVQELMAGGSRMARVESVEGLLFEVDGPSIRPLNAGDSLDEGQEIRTAKGSHALVRMADGSRIEMNERATLTLDASRKGNTIELDGGRVIVEAAKQRNRHLFVSTNDALVSVTGTIFSVNDGTKGTRVSVVEGEVRVKQSRRDDLLHPGDQVTTHASVARVPIRREISWSRNAEQYKQLLTELTALGKEIDAQVERPGLRYSTKLLSLAPEGTKAWVALPNLSHSLSETQRILDQKVENNPTVRQWWGETLGSSENEQKFREMIQKIGDLGRYLGDEVAVAIGGDHGEHDVEPVILAEVTNEAAFRSALEQEAAELKGKNGKDSLILVDDPANLPAGKPDGIYAWVGNGLFVASPNGAELARIASGAASPFASTPFHARIAQEYEEGAGWLFAADLAGFIGEDGPDAEEEALGIRDLQHFIVNRQEVEGRADTRAALTFSQERRGIASWLAAPAPMGALGFISPDATMAAAFIVRQPVSLLDDLLKASPEMAAELEKVKQEHGFDVREDLAVPLGGEFALAVDGPLLPTPSWKLVAEVYDPVRLQQTLAKMVQHVDDELRKEGKSGMTLREEESGGRTFYAIECVQPKVGVHYVFEDGYLVAGPTRALVERSLQQRESGVSLASHPKFRDLLGSDGQVNVSAFFYQNLEAVLEAASKVLPEAQKGQEGIPANLKNLLLGQGPTLIYAYAEEDRILFASSSTSPLGLNLQTLAGFGGFLGVMDEAHGDALRSQTETLAEEAR